ncbi:Copper binding periplasmic protein CusF [Caulobacter sp. AP07]|uniref:copper-binding protein n=1 Tax=Caulobacter sp. AP07 TaxID=1144304 RepID=UPI000271FCF9|nr:copper-binding protein [Caulobacter sp. AP07]EJL25515.1 Copper binding periplasmic protein CusF [Caulobacter sp. AP07]
MKIKIIFAISVAGVLAACGPGQSAKTPSKPAETAQAPVLAGPEYDSTGVIATLEGQLVTLDHEGASGAGLPAGRTAFQAYADVLAEAPLTSGTRVTFKFRKVGAGYELVELTAR